MFDKLKDLNQLRKLQSEMKKEQEQILVTKEKDGVEITMRGDNRVTKVLIDGEKNKLFKDLINDIQKELEKKNQKLAQSRMSDLGLPGF